MDKQRVGTSSSMENPESILYPSISICAYRKSTSKYFANMPWPGNYYQGSSGPTPDPNKILDSLSYYTEKNKSRFGSSKVKGTINYFGMVFQGFYQLAFIDIKVQAEMGN